MSFDEEFHYMATSVFQFIHNPRQRQYRDTALRRTQMLRSKAPEKMAPLLSELSRTIESEDRDKADKLLQKLLDCKRKISQ